MNISHSAYVSVKSQKNNIPSWEKLEAFLTIERKQAIGSIPALKSRFKIIFLWLAGREFNRNNFNEFLVFLKKKGTKPSYLNGYIKLAKHIDRFLKKEEFRDYSFFDEELSPPNDTLSFEEITKLAEVKIKYQRYKDKKIKIPALIYFLGIVGSRISETLLLEWKDLSGPPNCMVHFRAEITKTRKERYCTIPTWLYDKLQAFPKKEKYIFSLIERSCFNEELKVRALKAGIKKNIYPHLFRHSSVRNKLSLKMPLQEVTAYHGHTTPATTYKYYTMIEAQDIGDDLKNLDPAFKEDQTYEGMCSLIKSSLEKLFNPMLGKLNISTDGNKWSFELTKK